MEHISPQFLDPRVEIALLMQRVQAEGAVDSEIESLNNILVQFNNHTISAGEAVQQAQHIVDVRQNYH